jgi:hypothetical protein
VQQQQGGDGSAAGGGEDHVGINHPAAILPAEGANVGKEGAGVSAGGVSSGGGDGGCTILGAKVGVCAAPGATVSTIHGAMDDSTLQLKQPELTELNGADANEILLMMPDVPEELKIPWTLVAEHTSLLGAGGGGAAAGEFGVDLSMCQISMLYPGYGARFATAICTRGCSLLLPVHTVNCVQPLKDCYRLVHWARPDDRSTRPKETETNCNPTTPELRAPRPLRKLHPGDRKSGSAQEFAISGPVFKPHNILQWVGQAYSINRLKFEQQLDSFGGRVGHSRAVGIA